MMPQSTTLNDLQPFLHRLVKSFRCFRRSKIIGGVIFLTGRSFSVRTDTLFGSYTIGWHPTRFRYISP